MNQYVILINPDELSLWGYRKKLFSNEPSIVLIDRFAADDNGKLLFTAAINRLGSARFFMLINSADENYAFEEIPRLRKNDRRLLIDRLLDKHAANAPLRCCSATEKIGDPLQPSLANKERLLIYSLSQTRIFDYCRQTIAHVHSRIAGIYSIPCLAPYLAASSGCTCGVIVSLHGRYLRQCVISQGQLVLSRLTTLPETGNEIGEFKNAVLFEIRRLHVYVANNNLLDFRETAFYLLGFGRLEGSGHGNDDPDWLLPLKFDGIAVTLSSIDADEAYVRLLVKPHRFPQLGEPSLILDDVVYYRTRYLYFGTFAILAWLSVIAYHANEKNHDLHRQLLGIRNEIHNDAYSSPDETHSGHTLGEMPLQALAELDSLEHAFPAAGYSFNEALFELSRVLDRNPAVLLTKISWKRRETTVLTIEGSILADSKDNRQSKRQFEGFRADIEATFQAGTQVKYPQTGIEPAQKTARSPIHFRIDIVDGSDGLPMGATR